MPSQGAHQVASEVEMRRSGETPPYDVEGGGRRTSGIEGANIANGNSHHQGGVAACKPRTEERTWTCWLVPVVTMANVVVFVVTMYVNNCPSESGKCVATGLRWFSFQPFRENPLYGPSARTLDKMGALRWDKIEHQHQGWRLISCIVLHAGVIHLGVSVLSILFVGIRLEREFGFVRVGIIYLVSGFGGSVLSALFGTNRVSVGASGALFGLLGAMVSEIITNWTIYSSKVAALFTLLLVIAINLAVGIVPHVDNFAHIGGLLTGFFLGFMFLPQPQHGWIERHRLPPQAQANSKYNPCQIVLWVVSSVVLAAWFAVGLVMLFEGKNGYDRCYHWCRYLNCVPTSRWECQH